MRPYSSDSVRIALNVKREFYAILSEWYELSVDDRILLVKPVLRVICREFNIRQPFIVWAEEPVNGFIPFQYSIRFSKPWIKRCQSPAEFIYEVGHEAFHAYQWMRRHENETWAVGFRTYVDYRQDVNLYAAQPLEQDARFVAECLASMFRTISPRRVS